MKYILNKTENPSKDALDKFSFSIHSNIHKFSCQPGVTEFLLFSEAKQTKANKTENPSKDALDKADKYAKGKLGQLWPEDQTDQTNIPTG